MKKIILFLFFLNLTSPIRAQSFKAGLLAGLSATQVAGDQLSGFHQAGLLAGGFVYTPVGDAWNLQMEIYFIQKGSRKKVTESDNSIYIMRLNYAEVPLLATVKISQHLKAEAGPSVGVLLSSKEKTEFGEFTFPIPFEKIDFSMNIGLYYVFNEHWSVNVRYSQSVLPIRQDEGISYHTSFFDRGQYNTVLQNSLRYTF